MRFFAGCEARSCSEVFKSAYIHRFREPLNTPSSLTRSHPHSTIAPASSADLAFIQLLHRSVNLSILNRVLVTVRTRRIVHSGSGDRSRVTILAIAVTIRLLLQVPGHVGARFLPLRELVCRMMFQNGFDNHGETTLSGDTATRLMLAHYAKKRVAYNFLLEKTPYSACSHQGITSPHSTWCETLSGRTSIPLRFADPSIYHHR